MIKRELKTKIKEVDQIFHMADIHVLSVERHKEFLEVFDRLYKDIEKRKTDNSIIVVAGDIIHTKTELSPEQIDLIYKFFNSLSNLADLIIIPGNHDANLKNFDRLDSISPIVDSLRKDNIYYLRDSGVYTFANIQFVHNSVLTKSKFITYKDIEIDESKYQIGLYHNIVHGASTDLGYTFVSENVTTKNFDGMDIVLLGHIHKYQILRKYTDLLRVKKPAIAYPSSLIQRTYGEKLHPHGYLL